MFINRTLTTSAVILFLTLFCFLPESVFGAPPTAAEQDSLFKDNATQYFNQRGFGFSQEAYLYESYLIWLYQGIQKEAAKRRKEDWQATLDALAPLDVNTLNDSLYIVKEDLSKVDIKEAYLSWERMQRDKFNRKYASARHIKDKLLDNANSEQKLRMFRYDLKTAINSYKSYDYNIAIIRFNEVIDLYDYNDIGDVLFFRGESFFALALYDRAKIDYEDAIEKSTDTEIRLNSQQRLLSIAGQDGNLKEMRRIWSDYQTESGETPDEYYWETLDLYAHFLMGFGEWQEALESFDSFNEESGYFARGKLKAADCALAMLDYFGAESRYSQFTAGMISSPDLNRDMRREALLRLGYIEYIRNNYFDAYAILLEVEGDDDIAEKAMILSAWSVFKVNDYEKVIDICNRFLDKFPKTENYYEAYCMLGYSGEVLGKQDSAMSNYRVVMGAVDDKQSYQVFNYEKKNIANSLGELKLLEPALFLNKRDADFLRYNDLRKRLSKLMSQIRLAESSKATDKATELIAELKLLRGTFLEIETLEKKLYTTQDARLIRSYEMMMGKLLNLAADVNDGIDYSLWQKTLIQREEQNHFEARFGDSLRVQFKVEWESSEKSLKRVREMMKEAESLEADDLMIELSEVELNLLNHQQQLLLIKLQLNNIGDDEVASNLDWWSWFAFQRHSTAGLAFDHLYMREQRQKELDKYIGRINRILADRRAGIVEEVELTENLELSSEAGEESYTAPLVPLWQPEEEEQVEPEIEEDAEEAATDTLSEDATGEMPVNEMGTEAGEVTAEDVPEVIDVEGDEGMNVSEDQDAEIIEETDEETNGQNEDNEELLIEEGQLEEPVDSDDSNDATTEEPVVEDKPPADTPSDEEGAGMENTEDESENPEEDESTPVEEDQDGNTEEDENTNQQDE